MSLKIIESGYNPGKVCHTSPRPKSPAPTSRGSIQKKTTVGDVKKIIDAMARTKSDHEIFIINDANGLIIYAEPLDRPTLEKKLEVFKTFGE